MKKDFLDDSLIVKQQGQACKMTHVEALAYCQQQGKRLPTTRQLALFMNPAALLETEYVISKLGGKVPSGFYKVAGQDLNGVVDAFYYSNEAGLNGEKPRTLTGELAKLSFWTETLVLDNPHFAHVFYGYLGGGGAPDADRNYQEHERTFRHAVICLGPEIQ